MLHPKICSLKVRCCCCYRASSCVDGGDPAQAGAAPVLELELVALDMGLHFVEVLQALPAEQVVRRAAPHCQCAECKWL